MDLSILPLSFNFRVNSAFFDATDKDTWSNLLIDYKPLYTQNATKTKGNDVISTDTVRFEYFVSFTVNRQLTVHFALLCSLEASTFSCW